VPVAVATLGVGATLDSLGRVAATDSRVLFEASRAWHRGRSLIRADITPHEGQPLSFVTLFTRTWRPTVRLRCDVQDLLSRNRDFFRTGEPIRPDAYYTPAAQLRVIEQATESRRAGTALTFVIEDDGQLIGRINLNSLIRGAFQSASVGYLMDQHMTDRGIATAALRQVIDIAFSELNLHRLQAETLTDNPASQAVLRRCGFVHYGRGPGVLEGRWTLADQRPLPAHKPHLPLRVEAQRRAP